MFGQTFESHDILVVLLLVVLEGVLSIDNALVLGLLAKRLPKHLQGRALTYGLVGAFVFRLIAVATAAYLMQWRFVKLLGGGYLVYIAVKHLFFDAQEEEAEHLAATTDGQIVLTDQKTGRVVDDERAEVSLKERVPVPLPARKDEVLEEDPAASPVEPAAVEAATAEAALSDTAPASSRRARFWPTVLVIELTDVAFAIDSILAAIALAGDRREKLWVVLSGGMLGVILMRFAAILFIRMLERFPRFETAAYLLVTVIGLKLLADWGFNRPPAGWDPLKPYAGVLDFHSPHSPAFWVFWLLMVGAFCVGFLPPKKVAEARVEG